MAKTTLPRHIAYQGKYKYINEYTQKIEAKGSY